VLGDAGQTAERVGKDIYGVAYHDVHCVGRVLGDLGDNALLDADVGLDKLQARLSRFACDTRRYDDDVGAGGIFVVACVYNATAVIRQTLADVLRFTHGTLFGNIDDYDFVCQATACKRIGYRRADATAADDGNLVHTSSVPPVINKFDIFCQILVGVYRIDCFGRTQTRLRTCTYVQNTEIAQITTAKRKEIDNFFSYFPYCPIITLLLYH